MRHVPLGQTDTISEIMLGTMTYGTQTPEDDAHRQMDMAVDAGVTWVDTAHLYPVNPISSETLGLTEQIVGRWLAKGNSGKMRVATKHLGAGGYLPGGQITAETIATCIDDSLTRLRAETIDLYQLHWPNRGSFHFRQNWTYRPKGGRDAILQNMADCMGALEDASASGKIRAFGLSNESTWGMDQWLTLASGDDGGDGPARPVSIQNEYSLLCRLADTDLAELMAYEQVTMLAFSPLATGLLTGKYQNGALPDGSRRAINGNLGGRWSDRVEGAVALYLDLAAEHGVDPVHMALAWLQTRPFACSAILGATTTAQLEHALKAQDMTLSDELVTAIDDANRSYPLPY
ncbi:aldo/keto reductase [Jannaschia pohangensis]|uniref:Predicted oxidoreductase n=1 Tax=Jannaschia pohangensis TaxID=390807 RepID=A0A1I3IHA8_9RHOB|nr:aldo/keto reductase [Jannaschia pohangensis]SFI47280.1 Predicted oxidoreductase [Jannaschia pohangensis]